ncbi:MAG TPA: hypothetical protein DEP19_06650, partial [Anaerolineae bacterium]|nr:hypothetical protein [Anaerolineae bacterium]
MGGILLIFGTAVYFVVNFILITQVDNTLASVARELIRNVSINPVGELIVVRPPQLNMTANAYIQVWSIDGEIVDASPSIGEFSEPLDPIGLLNGETLYQDSTFEGVRLRVLTVPMSLEGRMIGTLQVGASLGLIEATRTDLVRIMISIGVIAVLLAALGSWAVLKRALTPLETIAYSVDQINKADDLSRRIPYRGRQDDEVSYLVVSFNQTLERLESLFKSQQRFLADVSHELRTPLTVIKGNIDLMRRIKTTDEDILNGMDDEVGRL